MPYQHPAIARMSRSAAYPDLAAPGKTGWEMQPVSGSQAFMACPVHIRTDDPGRAAAHFAQELATHAQRTGTRPWLLMPAAAKAFADLSQDFLVSCFSDLPPPAFIRRQRQEGKPGPIVWTARVDNNAVGHAALIVEVSGRTWRITRIDPICRDMGRVRLVGAASVAEIATMESDDAASWGLSPNLDAPASGDLIRQHFWHRINPRLADPYADCIGDPALRTSDLTWTRGGPEKLSRILRSIAWTDCDIPMDAYPFEIRISTALSASTPATIKSAHPALVPDAHVFTLALEQNHPVGWNIIQSNKDLLPRRSDWARIPLEVTFYIPAPSGHDQMQAAADLTDWLQDTSRGDKNQSKGPA